MDKETDYKVELDWIATLLKNNNKLFTELPDRNKTHYKQLKNIRLLLQASATKLCKFY